MNQYQYDLAQRSGVNIVLVAAVISAMREADPQMIDAGRMCFVRCGGRDVDLEARMWAAMIDVLIEPSC